jgi:hypothetical protein
VTGFSWDEIRICEAGGLNAIRLPVAAPQVSWEVSGPGAFSAFARSDDVRAAGLWTDLKGRWIDYASQVGRWGGVITAQPTTDNVVEIVGEGFLALLRGRPVSVPGVGMGAPGGFAQRILLEARASGSTFVTVGAVDQGGRVISFELLGDAGSDLLPLLAEGDEAEWTIDADRVFTFSRRLGSDKSDAIRLVEDRHILAHRVNDDVWGDAGGNPTLIDIAPEATTPAWFAVAPGIGANNPAVPSGRGDRPLTLATELTLANIDDCFTTVDLGDTCRVELGSIGVTGRFRVMIKALDVGSQTLTVSGEMLRDVAA